MLWKGVVMNDLLETQASRRRVGCAGIVVADLFCGPMDALPQEGMLSVLEEMPSRAGGCAANVAIDLVRQGIEVDLYGCIGAGGYGGMLVRELEKAGVNPSGLARVATHPTSRTVILLIKGEDRRYLHSFGANAAFRLDQIDRTQARQSGVFYLGGLFALPGIKLDELADFFADLRAAGVITVLDVVLPENFDPAGAPLADVLAQTDYFLPNQDEARLITGRSAPLDQVRALLDLGARRLVITRGRHGAVAATAGRYWECGVYQGEVMDPSGSGDAFCSGVIASILNGADMGDMLRHASAIGFSATRAIGTTDGVFGAAEAADFLQTHHLDLIEGNFTY